MNVDAKTDSLAMILAMVWPCPIMATGVVDSKLPGDDGALRLGVPLRPSRFSVEGTVPAAANCIRDAMTGLMWLRNPPTNQMKWADTLAYCRKLDGTQGRGGFADWRLPNLREMQSLLDYGQYAPPLPSGHPFIGVQAGGTYWTSSVRFPGGPTAIQAFSVSLYWGECSITQIVMSAYAWPVRGP